MLQVNDRVDSQPTNPDGKVTAEYLNKGSVKEVQNIVTQTSQTFDSGDLTQLGKGICAYASHGDFYTAGGTADAITASTNGSKVSPPSYADGMRVRFVAAGTNTGAATIDVNSLGAQSIRLGGSALAGGEIQAGRLTELWYDAANSRFELDLSGAGAWTLVQEVSLVGTNSFSVAGVPTTASSIRINFTGVNFGTADKPYVRCLNSGTPLTTDYNCSAVRWTGGAFARGHITTAIEACRDSNTPGTDTIDGVLILTKNASNGEWYFVGHSNLNELPGVASSFNIVEGLTPTVSSFNGIQFYSNSSNNFTGGTMAVYYQ